MKRILLSSLLGFFAFSLLLPVSAEAETDIVFSVDCAEQDMLDCEFLSGDDKKVKIPNPMQQGDQFDLQVFVLNPQQQDIVSVRSWLDYDSGNLKAIELSDDDSDFPLAAPDGNEIDEEFGQVKVGRGVAGGGVNDIKLFVINVKFEVISAQAQETKISFVNFQKEELGETGIFILDSSTFQPENILLEEPRHIELILNAGLQTPPDDSSGNEDPPEQGDPEEQGPDSIFLPSDLERPEGLRVEAKTGSTNLVWELDSDPDVQGYFVYYSESSGFYIRRSDVGKTNHKEFTDLNRNRTYYFAVTAYDTNGNESDYSDEVYAVHSVPGSESHPFVMKGGEEDHALTTSDQKLDESGPADAIYIALIVFGMFALYTLFRFRLFFSFSSSSHDHQQ